MRILSKSLHYQHIVRNEVTQQAQDTRGVLRTYPVERELCLAFSKIGLTRADVEFGLRHWSMGQQRDWMDPFSFDAWGAHPSTRDDVVEGTAIRGWRPEGQFSIFDTDNLTGDDKVAADEHFTMHPSGQDYVVVVKVALVPPWPTYEEMQWKKIGPTARDLGLVHEAAAYEQSRDEPREGVLKALYEEHVEAVTTAAEDEALKVIVP